MFQQSVIQCQAIAFSLQVSHQTVSGVKLRSKTEHDGTEEEKESKDPAAIRKSSDQMSRDLKLFFSFLIIGGG